MSFYVINEFLQGFCKAKKVDLKEIIIQTIIHTEDLYIIQLFVEEELFMIKCKPTPTKLGYYRDHFLVDKNTGDISMIDFDLLTGKIIRI
jgi:hypothetical protein